MFIHSQDEHSLQSANDRITSSVIAILHMSLLYHQAKECQDWADKNFIFF